MSSIPKSHAICPKRAKLIELIEKNLKQAEDRINAAELEEAPAESYDTDGVYWKKKKGSKTKCSSGKSKKSKTKTSKKRSTT